MTIRIQTDLLGELEVDEKDLLFFPRGLPGFGKFYRWFIAGEEEETIKWLVSADCGSVALPVASPGVIDPGYDPVFPEGSLESIGVEETGQAVLLAVLNLPRDNPLEGTANLLAPVVLNPATRMGRQVVLNDGRYSIHTPLVRAGKTAEGGAV